MISRINRKLLPMKGHYFLYNAATAPIIPFLPVLAKQLGFSGTIVGIMYTVLPICGMLAKPIMGGLADRFRIKKLLFLIFQLVSAAALFPINYIPKIPTESNVHFACDEGAAVFDTSRRNVSGYDCVVAKVEAEKGNSTLSCHVKCPMSEHDWQTVYEFWMGHKDNFTHEDIFSFVANVPVTKIDVIGNVVYFPVSSVLVDGHETKAYCPNKTYELSAICDLRCDSQAISDLLEVTHLQSMADVVGLYQFWMFFLLAIFAWVGMAVIVSIGDAICFELLGDKPNLYGIQRLWGSVGWGVFSILAGFMVDYFSPNGATKSYTSTFYLMLVIMALDLLCSSSLKYTQQRMSASIIRDIGKLLSRANIIVFMLWCIGVGMCTALVWQFLFWHLEELAARTGGCDMHLWIKTLEGLVMGIQCLGGELPFFFLSGWILKRLGHVHTMSFVLLCLGIRFILYSVLTDPWWVLPIEFMNGITFGLFYATMASYASIVAPPGTEATVQGLVGAVFEGVGVSLGSLLGGIFMDQYGGASTFRIFGIASFICCLVHFVIQYLMGKYTTQHEGKISEQNLNKINELTEKNDKLVIQDDEIINNMDNLDTKDQTIDFNVIKSDTDKATEIQLIQDSTYLKNIKTDTTEQPERSNSLPTDYSGAQISSEAVQIKEVDHKTYQPTE